MKTNPVEGGYRGDVLVAVYADVPAALDEEYNRWYDTHHIPPRLTIPGFRSAVRYRLQTLAGDGPGYLTLYELESTQALKHPKHEEFARDEWDTRMRAQVKTEAMTIYDRGLALGTGGEQHAPYLLSVRLDVLPEAVEEFNHWYDEEHLPLLSAVPGVASARRYRRRSGNGLEYLALYEYTSPDIRTSAAWQQAAGTPWTQKMQPQIPRRSIALGTKIFEAAAN